MNAVDSRAHDFPVLEGMSIFFAAACEPLHEVGDGLNGRRRLDRFLGLADALADPSEI
jgi:hypothetical protein